MLEQGRMVGIGIALTLLAVGPALAASPQEIPRTPSGRPDLSGTYNVATLTPLVRPREFGENLFLTREQAIEIAEQERSLLERGSEQSDPNRDAPPAGGAAPVGFDDEQRETLGAGNVGGYNSFWIDRGSEAFAIDGMYRTSILTDPANGQYPPLTPAAQERAMGRRRAFRPNDGTAYWLDEEGPGPYDDIEQRPLAERCLLGFGSTAGPPMMPVLYNNLKRIVQTDDAVMILVEMNHDVRVIRLSADHDPPAIRRWLGDSIGRWEGDTLVVESKHFRDQTALGGGTRDLHVVERFTRLDADRLHYEFTVQDPSTWSAPWKGDYVWPSTDEQVYEYACHEGNYAMGNIMRGARLLEAEAMAKKSATNE
ncbi:MAG TPA: hypothetical protein VNB06_15185 [Thermoanaerobaculia bacterium]|nr:hypothetical protein [Thermoanaerobaculia bacterium]